MALAPRLDLRQSQQLVMTPQLQQAIKLLQLSNLDLQAYVAEEVERNPLLEVGDPNADTAPVTAEEAGGATTDRADASDSASDYTGMEGEPGDGMITSDASLDTGIDAGGAGEGALDTDFSDTSYTEDAVSDRVAEAASVSDRGLSLDGGRSASGAGSGGDDRGLDQTLEGEESLADVLERQLLIEFRDPDNMMIASHLADMVDEAGYLPATAVSDVAERLGSDDLHVTGILTRMQTFEPAGVCARSLPECLAIQLKDQDRLDPLMQSFLNHLDLLGKGDLAELKRITGADDEDLTDMISEIRALNPKPGLAYGLDAVQTVVPDIFIRKTRAGLWTVELNQETLPRVLMNNQYLAELEGLGADKEAKTFVSDCMANANWLVKALDQRARTILKVSSALVKRQEGFFEYGVRYLKPMTLKDIADEIDMHESTVSRVTSNKYMACPRGLFELKYFFSSSISSSAGGDAHSAEAVKYRIKELIDAEDPKKILSDDKIVAIMQGEGIDIARRTVAKYREAMRIPSSVQRRRQKRMA